MEGIGLNYVFGKLNYKLKNDACQQKSVLTYFKIEKNIVLLPTDFKN